MLTTYAPRDLVDLRLNLLNDWRDDGIFAEGARQGLYSTLNVGDWPDDGHLGAILWERDTLKRASLWWVKAEMVNLMLAASASVPADTRLDDLRPPSIAGLAYFEQPWVGIDAVSGDRCVQVDAIVWGPIAEPGRGGKIARWAVSFYARAEPMAIRSWGKGGVHSGWAPLGRSDWDIGQPLSSGLIGYEKLTLTDAQRESFMEDRRILAALWALIDMKITETPEAPVHRAARRRQHRAIGGGAPDTVRVVRLREVRHEGEEDESGLQGSRHYTHRWWVNPFWRWQHYGPKNSRRKLILVEGHIRGPADKPLVLKQEVRAWIR